MVGIYCRISKQKVKGQDVSIEVQKKQGIAFAKSQGMEFRVFVDEGISGNNDKISERPDFAMLLQAIKSEEISIVYCYDQSRIERNNKIWNMFLSLMLEKNCKYYPNGKLLDLDVPENQFFTGVMSLANELYSALTGIKVKETIYENALKGKTHGLTAYGYTKDNEGYFRIKDDEDDNEAEIVKRIFSLSLQGIGTYTIANILNNEGVPTKFRQFEGQIHRRDKDTNTVSTYEKNNVRWRGNVIHDIIKNPIYKGTRMWNGEPISVPPILSEEYWQEVNDNLEKNKKKVGKREEYKYLLNGLIYCAHCGSEYRGKKRLKGNDNAYKCKGKQRHYIECDSRGISLPKLETFIIHHLFISKDLENYLVGLPKDNQESDVLKNKLNREKKVLEKLIRIKDTAYKHLLDPDFQDDEVIKAELIATKKRIIDKEKAIELLQNKLIERNGKSRAKRVKNTIGKFNLNASFEETRRLVHSLIEKITISHQVKQPKGGYFLLKIEYKGFDETSMFMTDWQAMKWYWMGHYRSKAVSKEDLEDDRELIKSIAKERGVNIDIPDDFKGLETYSSGGTLIEIKREELIDFDKI